MLLKSQFLIFHYFKNHHSLIDIRCSSFYPFFIVKINVMSPGGSTNENPKLKRLKKIRANCRSHRTLLYHRYKAPSWIGLRAQPHIHILILLVFTDKLLIEQSDITSWRTLKLFLKRILFQIPPQIKYFWSIYTQINRKYWIYPMNGILLFNHCYSAYCHRLYVRFVEKAKNYWIFMGHLKQTFLTV